MLEVLCDGQPFQGITRSPNHEHEINELLRQRLMEYTTNFAEHPFVKWLVHWIDMDITHFLSVQDYPDSIPSAAQRSDNKRNYSVMLEKIIAFQASGFTLAR